MSDRALTSASVEWRQHWPLVVAAGMGMSLAALLSAVFGVMLEPLQQEFGWSRVEISSGPVIVSIMGLILATPAGYMIDRYGARRCGIFVVLISCVSIASMGLIGSSLWQWWGAWVLFGLAGAFTSTVWMAPISNTFRAGRGLAIAATLSGTGISTLIGPGIAEYFVQNQGWRVGFFALSALWLSVTLPLVLAFVPRHIAVRKKDLEHNTGTLETALPGLTIRQGLATRTLYFLFIACLLSALFSVALILNLVPVLTSTGISRAEAIGIISTMGLVSIIGRLVGGALLDRFDARHIAIAASFISLALPVALLMFPGDARAAMIGVIAFGATGGMKMNASVYLVSERFGARSFGFFYSLISITFSVAQGIGPLAANYVYDVQGTYTPVIWSVIPAFAVSAVLFLALGRAPDGEPTGK